MEKLLKSKTVQLVTIEVDDYMLHVNSRGTTFEYQGAPDWTTFSVKQETNRQVARPGDHEYIFGRPRLNVSRLKRPGAVKAWLN